jgi:hypothetical protein
MVFEIFHHPVKSIRTFSFDLQVFISGNSSFVPSGRSHRVIKDLNSGKIKASIEIFPRLITAAEV